VVGRERVRVTAGEFNAWKGESRSESIVQHNFAFAIKCTFRYSPEMKRSVRMNIVTESAIAAVSY
jgi:hypothetical protein